MSKMLLSIKPEYVEKISGKKKYEFRKFHCRPDIDTIIIYSTSPVKQVVAEVKMIGILEGDVAEIWQKTKEAAGITKTAFLLIIEAEKLQPRISLVKSPYTTNQKNSLIMVSLMCLSLLPT